MPRHPSRRRVSLPTSASLFLWRCASVRCSASVLVEAAQLETHSFSLAALLSTDSSDIQHSAPTMQRIVSSHAECQCARPPALPAQTQRVNDTADAPPAAASSSVARTLTVSQYLEELWTVEARPSQLVRPDEECDESAKLQPEEDDESDAASAAASGPGSLSSLLHSLYQVPPPVPSTASSSGGKRHVHLLPRHPNLLPIEEWIQPAPVPAAAAASSSPARPSAASSAHQLHFASVPLSLHSLLRFYQRPGLLASMSSSPSTLSASSVFSAAQTRFMLYQLLHCLTWLHEECGVSHGELTPENLRITLTNGKVWIMLGGLRFEMPEAGSTAQQLHQQRRPRRSSAAHRPRVERLISPLLPPADSLCFQWWSGALSNMQYILALNALAGRTPFGAGSGAGNGAESAGAGPFSGDVAFHPIVPWVVDFTATDAAVAAAKSSAVAASAAPFSLSSSLPSLLVYRDLRKSKYRLKKGDEQLDFQFTNSTPHRPYHITECLSDITFFVYRARITQLSVLRRTVRQNFVAEEYPNTISKMEKWTPDEAIPELFGVNFEQQQQQQSGSGSASAVATAAACTVAPDSSNSCGVSPRACDFMKALPGHREKGMYDLAVPSWIVEIEEEKRRGDSGSVPVAAVASDLDPHALFLSWHASQLESEHVSLNLHHWIDLNFGFKLSGAAAVAAKNVPLLYEQTMQQQEGTAAGGRTAAAASNSAGGASNQAAPSAAPMSVFDLPRRPSFMQLFDRPHPPRRATTSRKVAPATATASGHAGSNATVDAQAPRAVVAAVAPSDSSTAALASIPASLSALHSFEYFHSFNSGVFEASVAGGCYRTPPRGIMQWRRGRAREEERKRRRRRGEASSSESSSDDEDDGDPSAHLSPSASSNHHCSDDDSEVASLSERAADDLFRFGLILFELYAARPLFTEKSFHAYCSCDNESKALAVLLAPLPTEIAAVASRCLALDWRARVTAGELLRAPIHGGLGLFRVLVPHAPHALTLSPLTNLLLNPYAELFRFLRRWRMLTRRYAGGLEGLLGSHASRASGQALVAGNDDVTPAASTLSADTSASAMLLTPFSVPSQRPYSAHAASSSSRPATPTVPQQQRNVLSDAHQQTVHSTFSFSVSHALPRSGQGPSNDTTEAAASAAATAGQMFDSSHCFWACAAHGISQALPPPSTDDEPTDVASMLRWSLAALHDLHATLWSSAPSVFLLALPHVLDLCLTPSFLQDPLQHDLLRLVIDTLARWIGPAHAAVHVAPFLAQLLFHSSALSFQLSFVWQMETLRLVRDRFAYRDMQQPYMRALRNAMLSAVPALAERAHDLLLQCVLQMDLGSTAAAIPHSAALSVVPASPSPTDEELLVFELLRPMFQRLSASPASTHAGTGGLSSGLVSPPPSASSVDKILHFLFALLPELPTSLLAHFVLPNVLQLVSASGVHVLPPAGQIVGGSGGIGGGAGGRSSALAASNADLDGKLSNALDLLFALLPDLSCDTLHSLLGEESLLRALFLSVSPAPPLVGGIAPRPILAHAMRKVIQILVYACCELAGDKADPPPAATSGRSAAQQPQQHSRFSFFLPCVSDFLRGVLMRLDASSPSAAALDPTLATHYTSAELQGFLHSVYVSLSSILGRPAMQQAIAQSDKVESMVQEHAKQQYEEAQARVAAAAATEHPTAAAAAALHSASSSGMNELLRARQHALQGKNSRLTWLRAQQSRALALQHSREQLQHERAELAFQAGISIAGDSHRSARRPRPDTLLGADALARPRGSFIDTSSSSASGADGVSVVVDVDAEGGDAELSGDEADEPSPAISSATPHSQQSAGAQASKTQTATQQAEAKGAKKNKLTGFFSTGIFAPRGSPSHSGTAGAGAGSQQLASASGDSAAQSTINALPPPNLSSGASSSAAASSGAGAPASAISPPSSALPLLSNARVPLDFGDMILPSVASGSSSVNARFEPVMRCTFRAHVGGLSSLDCHPASGLFISSSRNADAHSTVKLWSVSVSDSSIRPLFDYSKKHHATSASSALAQPPRFPKTIVSHVQLLVNPYEVLNAAFAYCDGAQLHVCDIETHKPIVFRHNSGHISNIGSGSSQLLQPVPAKGQPPTRHLSGTGDPLLVAAIPATLISPTSSSSASSASGAAHHFKSDGSALVGGISCFDYSPSMHSLVLGTSSGGLRWLDLRSGGGFVSSAWHLSNSNPVAPALRCVLASESGGSVSGGGSCAASSLVYTGLSNGEVAVFDARTGYVLLQWRAHDAPILQLASTHNSEGMPILVASGADHTISVWMLAGGAAPILLQRFLNLEENARGLTILRGTAAGGATQLSCTIGSRMALVSIQTSELSAGSKRPSTVLPLAPVSGYKGKSAFSCQSHLPLYGLSLLGTDDGRIIGAK